MNLKYLKHLAKNGSTFIHPKGFDATNLLISKLRIQPSDSILEIGCGTGGTLAEITGRYNINIHAVEILDEMIQAAEKNLRNAHLDKYVKIYGISENEKYPFPENTFDKIYSESVIGFQNAQTMEFIFTEIRRIIKPNGLCIINDALWNKGVPDSMINEIIQSAYKDFGLAHASPSNIDMESIIKIADNSGLKVIENVELDTYFKTRNSTNNTERSRRISSENKISLNNVLNDLKYRIKHKKHAKFRKYITSYLISFTVK